MQTVPLHPDGGGGQRENLMEIPSGVFRIPTTAASGTGLAGMETSFIRTYFRNSAALHAAGRSPPGAARTASIIGIAVGTQRKRGKSSLWSLRGSAAAPRASLKPRLAPPYRRSAGHPAAR